MSIRGIRGATVVEEDQPEAILAATRELLLAILEANPKLHPKDLASALFTVTDDLTSTYPAKAARNLGWTQVPILCGREIPVPDGLPKCVRVLLHWNTSLSTDDIHHIYLGEAQRLRPDWFEHS